MSLERNNNTVPHVINISFIITVSNFISAAETQELVIVKDLSYYEERNMLQEKNLVAIGVFCTSINMRNQSNLSEEKFQKIIFLQASSKAWHLKCLLFMEIMVFRRILDNITQVIQLFRLLYYHYENINYLGDFPHDSKIMKMKMEYRVN